MLAGLDGQLRAVASTNAAADFLEPMQLQATQGPCLDCVTTGAPVSMADLSDPSAAARWPRFVAIITRAVTPLGAVGTTIVLNVSDGLSHAVLAVDARTGTVLSTRANFATGALSAATVIGAEHEASGADIEHVIGTSVADGQSWWAQLHGYGFHVSPAGPTLVESDGQLSTSAHRSTIQLLSAAIGTSATQLPSLAMSESSRCVYDQTSVTVCSASTDPRAGARVVVAVDATTGRQLWSLPNQCPSDDGSEAPLITTAWHRLVLTTRDNATTDGPPARLSAETTPRAPAPPSTKPGPAESLLSPPALPPAGRRPHRSRSQPRPHPHFREPTSLKQTRRIAAVGRPRFHVDELFVIGTRWLGHIARCAP